MYIVEGHIMTDKQRQSLEIKNNTPTRAKIHKKWKNIAQELSDLSLNITDLDPLTSSKPQLALELCKKNDVTLGELIVLRQAFKAIEEGDTRAAEFFRDTMGENPKQVLEVQKSALSQMTDEEIEEQLAILNGYTNKSED